MNGGETTVHWDIPAFRDFGFSMDDFIAQSRIWLRSLDKDLDSPSFYLTLAALIVCCPLVAIAMWRLYRFVNRGSIDPATGQVVYNDEPKQLASNIIKVQSLVVNDHRACQNLPSYSLRILEEDAFPAGRWHWSVHDGWISWMDGENNISLPISSITHMVLRRTDQLCILVIGGNGTFAFSYRLEDSLAASTLRLAILGVPGVTKSEADVLDGSASAAAV